MTKPTRSPTEQVSNKVWQPSGYGGIQIGIKISKSELEFPKYFLQNYTIVLNGIGEGKVRYRGNRYTFTDLQNLVFLQNPGTIFSGRFWGEEGTNGVCIIIPPSRLHQLLNRLGINCTAFFNDLLLPEKSNDTVARQIGNLIRTFTTPTSRLERESQLLSSIETIFLYGSAVIVPERSLGEEHKAIATIKEVLHSHPGKNHSLASLSLLTGLNQKYLIDVFTKNVGIPPHRYLTNLRIHQAKARLAQGEAIANIAIDLGFYDQSHFSRTFKHYVLVSPGQFRRDSVTNT